MFNKRVPHIFDLYRYLPDEEAFVFDISISDYKHIFNVLDPSPFRKRDLSPDLLSYLDQCSNDIPLKYKVIIYITLTGQIPDAENEQEVISGLQTNFLYNVNYFSNQIWHSRKKALLYIALSFVGISIPALAQDFFSANLILSFFREGLIIGGWVFLWEAFSMLFIQMDEISHNLKKYKRLLSSKILFTYAPLKS